MRLWLTTLLILLISSQVMAQGETISRTCTESWIEFSVTGTSVDTATATEFLAPVAVNMNHSDIMITGTDSAVSCWVPGPTNTLFQFQYICNDLHDWDMTYWVNGYASVDSQLDSFAVNLRIDTTIFSIDAIGGSLSIQDIRGTTSAFRNSFTTRVAGVEIDPNFFMTLTVTRQPLLDDHNFHALSGTRIRLVSRKC